jgi:hypothetical protein
MPLENLKIEVEETKNYKQRMRYLLMGGGLFILVFGLLLYYMPGPKRKISDSEAFYMALYACIMFYLLLILRFDIICAYHISLLEIKENRLHLIFTKRGKAIELDDLIEKFEFTTRSPWENGGLPLFIKIKYNGKLTARQHKVWGWKRQGAFDQTVEYLKKHKLLGKTSSVV